MKTSSRSGTSCPAREIKGAAQVGKGLARFHKLPQESEKWGGAFVVLHEDTRVVDLKVELQKLSGS